MHRIQTKKIFIRSSGRTELATFYRYFYQLARKRRENCGVYSVQQGARSCDDSSGNVVQVQQRPSNIVRSLSFITNKPPLHFRHEITRVTHRVSNTCTLKPTSCCTRKTILNKVTQKTNRGILIFIIIERVEVANICRDAFVVVVVVDGKNFLFSLGRVLGENGGRWQSLKSGTLSISTTTLYQRVVL